MKTIVASDIHNNLEYTKKLIELIESKNPENIILLGDIFNGINDIEILKMLNKYSDKILSVYGNCDMYLDNIAISDIKFNRDNWILKVTIDGIKYFITHKPDDITLGDCDYAFYGHTHLYDIDSIYINPGSVGSPRNLREHTCIYMEDSNIELINLDNFEILRSKKIEKRQ